MYIIAGLGNPTSKYEKTRHNVGFDAIDEIAQRYNIKVETLKHKAECGTGIIGGEKVILVKPLTYMNLSGESISAIASYYKVDVKKEVIVIYDDISMEPGRIRIRKKGSAGGHNGIKNIISHFGSEEFLRIKIGVGEKPQGYDLADYVLSYFDKKTRDIIDNSLADVKNVVETIITEGYESAANKFN